MYRNNLYLVLLFLTICFLACKDDIIVNEPKSLIVKKEGVAFTQPITEFTFSQFFRQNIVNKADSSATSITIKNISNNLIDSLTFYIQVFKSIESTGSNLAYHYKGIIKNLAVNQVSTGLEINKSSFIPLESDLIETIIIQYNNLKHKYGNVYQGNFIAFENDSTVTHIGLVNGYVSIDGKLKLRMESTANVQAIEGGVSVNGDTLVLAKAVQKDAALISNIKLKKDTELLLKNDSLSFVVDFLEPINADKIKEIKFNLVKVK
jgi:hypothetical protein